MDTCKHFNHIHVRLCETGCFQRTVDIPETPMIVQTVELEETVLNRI